MKINDHYNIINKYEKYINNLNEKYKSNKNRYNCWEVNYCKSEEDELDELLIKKFNISLEELEAMLKEHYPEKMI